MINRALEAICSAILAATVVIAFVAVIFRYVIGSALSWSFEASLALLTYLTFFGCYLALRKGSHLRVDVFVNRLPLLGQTILFAANQLIIAAVAGVMLYHGWRQVILYHTQTTLVMELPVGYLYSAIPISGLLMGVDAVAILVLGLRRYARGESPMPSDVESSPSL